MKKELLVIFFVFVFGYTNAQSKYSSDYTNEMTLIRTFDRTSGKIEGSPYYTEDFEAGTIKIEGKEPLEVYLRYNVSKEEIEIKTERQSEKTYIFPRGEKVTYKIGAATFNLDKIWYEGDPIFGYFIEKFTGDKVRFLLKPVAEFIPAVEARTGYDEDEPAKIKIETEYFLVFPDGKVENIRLKNRVIRKIFDSKASKKYLSEHDIDTVKDLISFLELQEGFQE